MGHAHAHPHRHDHGPQAAHGPADFGRAFAIGTALNLAFVAVELGLGLYANSLALISDAAHNFADVIGLVLAWAGAWLAARRPTPSRTYGFRRASILAALANAALLMLATGAIALEALRRLAAPEPVATNIVLIAAGAGIAVNTATALMFMRGRHGDLNVRGAFLHMAADAGVSLAVVVAALLIGVTGWLWLDPAMSLAVAAVILVSGWSLARDSLDLALDAVPRHIDRHQVEALLAALPGVGGVHDLHIWAMSTTETALTAHLVLPEGGDQDELLRQAGAGLAAGFGIRHATLQIETGAAACTLAPRRMA